MQHYPLDHLLDPRPEPRGSASVWFHLGERANISTPEELALELSKIMDRIYLQAPRIRNELINRRVLSSAASAARRNLAERMLTRSTESGLGIDGYPPERSMYESVLLSSHLHRHQDEGWSFCWPDCDDPIHITPVWRVMEDRLFASKPELYSVSKLFDELSAPPFGVMPGVLPILLLGFVLANGKEISIYREGRFIPDLNVSDFEVLMRRPELFAIEGVRISGSRALVVGRMARGLGVPPGVVPVVRALILRVKAIPETAWRTRSLSPDASRLRQAFENAQSPENLLFRDIPIALEQKPLTENDTTEEQVECFFQRLNGALDSWSFFTPGLIDRARMTLLEVCGLKASDSGWRELRRLASELQDAPLNALLLPFVRRATVSGDDDAVLEGILALVAGKPPRLWTDSDFERFCAQAKLLGQQFSDARHLTLTLTEDERVQQEEIVSRLRTDLTSRVPPHVLKAAMSRLLQEL